MTVGARVGVGRPHPHPHPHPFPLPLWPHPPRGLGGLSARAEPLPPRPPHRRQINRFNCRFVSAAGPQTGRMSNFDLVPAVIVAVKPQTWRVCGLPQSGTNPRVVSVSTCIVNGGRLHADTAFVEKPSVFKAREKQNVSFLRNYWTKEWPRVSDLWRLLGRGATWVHYYYNFFFNYNYDQKNHPDAVYII